MNGSPIKDKLTALFGSTEWKALYDCFLATVREHNMSSIIRKGILVGFSGGSDSVMLLLALYRYRELSNEDFSLVACHVNHMIRDDEADRDAEFSARFCKELGIEFVCEKIDVPVLSRSFGIGIEEAARNARYSIFNNIIVGRNDLSAIATAHNATDNCETVIYNLCRGAALSGASGIPPVRNNIIRPLIAVSKDSILDLLKSYSIDFIHDSTNDSDEYTRNYIRHNILPHLAKVNPSYIRTFSDFSFMARRDNEYLDSISEDFVLKSSDGVLLAKDLRSLKYPIFSRVIIKLARQFGSSLEKNHVDKIYELISGDNFRLSLPCDITFLVERGVCRFVANSNLEDITLNKRLSFGYNELDCFDGAIIVNNKADDFSRNVYKFSISVCISSAIIKGSLSVRFKEDGDSYYYGGMTHKLKKVFNDYGIPPTIRNRIPVITDEKGILWVPGLPPRADEEGCQDRSSVYLTFVTLDNGLQPIYPVTKYDIKRRKDIT